ncbi:MAG: type II secretion system protein [Tepidisphaeraceae bacterium]
MSNRPTQRAFTLVELLVVLGIIAVLMGILIPAVMYAHKSGRETLCANNLKQLGAYLLMYANANDDKLICGTSDRCNETKRTRYRTDWNSYAFYESCPSAALGPLVQNGTLHRGNYRLAYCPVDKREAMYPEVWESRWPGAKAKDEHKTPIYVLKIGYVVRPEQKIRGHAGPRLECEPPVPLPGVGYPKPMPRLSDAVNHALITDVIGTEKYGHGSPNAPKLNVLYGDGSVVTADVPRPDRDLFYSDDAGNKANSNDTPGIAFWGLVNTDLPEPDKSRKYGDNNVLMNAWLKLDRKSGG